LLAYNANLPAMRKFLPLILLAAIISGVAVFLQRPAPPVLPDNLLLALSTDGPLQPGHTQEMLLHAFSSQQGRLTRETALRLSASVSRSASGTAMLSPEIITFAQHRDGSYRSLIKVPEDMYGTATISVFPSGYPDKELLKSSIVCGNSPGLIILPPAAPVHPGNWVSFRIALLNRKSGKGIFKAPVRVKMKTPAGHDTINRVVLTDLYGTAFFTTHLHSSSAYGLHHFDFSSGNSVQSLPMPVLPQPDKAVLAQKLIRNEPDLLSSISSAFLNSLTIASPPVHILKYGNTSSETSSRLLEEFKVEIDQAFITYDCTGSDYRHVEIWQNGHLIYSSDLQLESGRISVPFPHPPEQSQPIFAKIWEMKGNTLKVQEKSALLHGRTPSPVLSFMKDAAAYLQNTEPFELASMFFTSPGFMATNQSNNVLSLTEDGMVQLIPTAECLPAQPADPGRFFTESEISGRSFKRFFLVGDELALGRYRFSSLKIWLYPPRFFTSLIASFRNQPANVDFLIGEAECRALRFVFLSIADQPAELEKMEGILAVLAELNDYAEAHPERATNWRSSLKRAIGRLDKLIHTPASISPAPGALNPEDGIFGPFSPVQTFDITLDKLYQALKPGGKVTLKTGERGIPLTLSGDSVTFRSRSLPGLNNRPDKLINTRTEPVIVELDFSEPE